MNAFKKIKIHFASWVSAAVSILFSGLCWHLSTGLSGDDWYLLWIAPVPVLLLALNPKVRHTFFITFLAYFIGRLSWFGYLVTVATLVPAILFTVTLSLIFAGIMLLTRKMVVNTSSWYSLFAFPVFFTAFEWLLITFSPDGSAASIAYSQLNFLPVAQIASITGMLGITFLVTLVPAALAMGWHFRKERTKLLQVSVVSSVLVISALLYGYIRISTIPKTDETTAGLVVLDEKTHKMGPLDFQMEVGHTREYAREIDKLAAGGVKLIVFPERAINVNRETDSVTVSILSACARQYQVSIVAGYTNFKNEKAHNSALVIDENGHVTLDYDKIHLINGLENQFVPGNRLGLFKFGNVRSGIAICKDLDFPGYIHQYGRSRVAFLCIPAWDFVVDDWLHSRMAILRGVENGFSEVRTARLGRLTISDPYGRINAEAKCSDGKAATLVGQVSIQGVDTFYMQFGDWFGWLVAIAAIVFLILTMAKSKAQYNIG